MTSLDLLARSYDEVPYPDYVFWFTHPEHLGMLGRLFGLKTASLKGARVLEIGCAVGGNLLPMATSQPQARFVGCDLSQAHIAQAQAQAESAGLTNVRFIQADACNLPEDLGRFDYIICHGVFSWVPEATQEGLLASIHAHLNPHGIAFVSYNTYPGQHMVDLVRKLTRHHTSSLDSLRARSQSALDITEWLLERARQNPKDWRTPFLERELSSMRASPTSAIVHDYLPEHHHAHYFLDFVTQAERHNLTYLCNSSPWDMYVDNQAPELAQALHQLGDLLEQQQYIDFVKNTRFRRTLLCRREDAKPPHVYAESIYDFYVGHGLLNPPDLEGIAEQRPVSLPVSNHPPLVVSHPLLRMALYLLWHHGRRWPHFNELAHQVQVGLTELGLCPELTEAFDALKQRLASQLLRAFFSEGVRFGLSSPPVVTEVPDYPKTAPYQRLLATQGASSVANLCQEAIHLSPEALQLLPYLDGTRTAQALSELVPHGEKALWELAVKGFLLSTSP